MTWFLYVIAIAYIAAGSILVLNTESAREFLDGVIDEARYRLWGILALVVGSLLAISSFWSSVTWFVFLLGLMGVGKGAFLLLGDEGTIAGLVDNWKQMTDRGLRLWGLIAVITGVAILAWT